MESLMHTVQSLIAANPFLQGGLVLGVLTSVFYQLKSIPMTVYNKFKTWATYQIYFDDSDAFYDVFSVWFHEKYPHKFRNVELRFQPIQDDSPEEVEPEPGQRRHHQLHKFQYADSNLIFYKNRLLWVRKQRDRLDGARDRRTRHLNSYIVSGLFAKHAISHLADEILSRKKEQAKKSCLTVHTQKSSDWFVERDVHIVKTFDHIFFDGKDNLVKDLDQFSARKDFYRDRGINYKRSYLFYGPGGTGKTTVASAIAKYLGYDLWVINLASMSGDRELQTITTYLGSRSVILIEDIDCVLNQRDATKGKFNFSTLLNFLDGVTAPSDCVFVMTTNKPEQLDAALVRKGRVDFSLLVDLPRITDIEAYMTDFYDQLVILDMAGYRSDIPMAAVQDICLRHENVDEAIAAVASHLIPIGKVKTAA
jgi:chaperone BCS1